MKKIYLLLLLACVSFYGSSQTWNLQNSGTNEMLCDVGFIDQSQGYAVGMFGVVLFTSNGGQTWSPVTSPATGFSFYGVSIPMPGKSQAKVILSAESGRIYYADFGTTNWQQATTGVTAQMNDINLHEWSSSSTTGYAVGENGTVLKTTDDGATWTKLTTFNYPTAYLTCVSAADDNHITVAGDNGFVATSEDGGSTWTEVQAVPYVYMKAVAMIPFPDTARLVPTTYVGGSEGTLGTLVDNVFTPINLGTNLGIMGLTFTGPSFGLGVGDLGFVTHWDGTNWTTQTTPTSEYLQNADGFCVPVDNTNDYTVYAWAVGTNGTIISTVQNVISGVGKPPAGEKLSLSPNPSSGTVRVTGLPDNRAFTLRLDDLSGKLVSEFKGTGPSDIGLNGIAPGVYFATIKTDLTVTCRKLILR